MSKKPCAPSLEIVIDLNEHGLYYLLNALNPVHVTREHIEPYTVIYRSPTVQSSDVADVVYCIKRFTVNDLARLLREGRLRNIKKQLSVNHTNFQRSLIIIEGDLNASPHEKVDNIPISTLIGSIINTQLVDGIPVYKTQSMKETLHYTVKLKEKLESDMNRMFMAGYHNLSPSSKPKVVMNPQSWMIHVLSSLPHVTADIAKCIAQQYPTMVILLHEYERTPEHLRPLLLTHLRYPVSSGKFRRLGPAVSYRIYESLYGIAESDT